jgi:alpha-beta hydrolase superfamily lysophospholipase
MRSINSDSGKNRLDVKKNKVLGLSLALLCLLASQVGASAQPAQTQSRMLLGGAEVPVFTYSDNSVATKGVIVAVHGAARHGGTFEVLAEHLASLGYLVLSPDLRGHGQWVYAKWSTPQDKIADWDKSTDDVVNLLTEMRNQHQTLPLFCMGESAGAMVALRAGARCPSINGLILSSIGTSPCVHDVGKIFHDAIIGATNVNKPLDVREVLAKYSSEDDRVREEAAKDPLGRDGLSVRELIRTDWLLSRVDSYASHLPSHIPVLVMQGDEDKICKASSAKGVEKHLASKEKQYETFHSGHILLSTPFIRQDVMSAVSDWLKDKTAEQQTALLSGATTTR